MSDHDPAPHSAAQHSVRPHTRWGFTVLFGVVGAIVVGVVVLAFAWPSATARARDLPVGIAGPSGQVSSLKSALAKLDPDPFQLEKVDSRAAAVRDIRERHLYGAILLGDSPEVLTSSAASTASNQALHGVAAQLQQQISARATQALVQKVQQLGTALAEARSGSLPSSTSGAPSGTASGSAEVPTVKVTDVVALSDDDPTGAGLTASAFPLALGGMLGGILISLLVVGVIRRLLALVVFGAAAGATVTLILQTTLHALHRDWIVNAGAIGLAMVATAALVVGCNALFGRAGIAIGAIVTVLIGNPISGASVPWQFLPEPWGAVGQYFVPGAASSLLRSLSYFPDADTAPQWIILGAWAAGGMLLAIVGHFRSQAPIELPAGELAAEHHRHVAA